MSGTSAPAEFLGELGSINGLIADLLDCPRKPGWHWPSFYLLYVEVDRLSMVLMRVRYLFDSPFAAVEAPLRPAEYAAGANELFRVLDKRQKAIIGSLWQMCRETQRAAGQEAVHARACAHVHPKSGWYQTFMSRYRSGVVADDGTTLSSDALPVAEDGAHERIDFNTAECMMRHRSFDIGSRQTRLALASATQAVEGEVGAVLARMGKYLLAHCTIGNLLHPSSR